jgi:superfamily II DNA or RNA helicase
MKLRQHQKECIDKIDEHFKTETTGLIKMFCGAGKSFIIYHCLLKYTKNLSVIVVPSISLITQFNRDYLLNEEQKEYNDKYFNLSYELLTVCSKNEVDKSLKGKFSFTTNPETITKFLHNEFNKIVLITYQSLELFITIIKENNFEIDIMCFDEAHHILGDGMKKLLFGQYSDFDEYEYDDNDDKDDDDKDDDDKDEDDKYEDDKDEYEDEYEDVSDYEDSFIDSYVKKSLYFTATPKNKNEIKMYEPVTEITVNDDYFELVNDEDTYDCEKIHCGKMIFEYMHIDGVNDNILNDFKIMVDLFTDNNNNDSIFDAISRAILQTGNNRVLTFHSRSQTKSEKGSDVLSFSDKSNKDNFIKCFNKILKSEFSDKKHKYKNIEFVGITANTKNKMDILNEFDSSKDDEIFILASCKTIGEGVDTKNANMVVFIDPKQSYVEIIQNIGRICRKQNKLSTVLIPSYVNLNKYKECKTIQEKDNIIRNEMNKNGDFNTILNVLTALIQEDPYIFEMCLNHPDKFTKKEIDDNLKKHSVKIKSKKYTLKKLFDKYDVEYDEGKDNMEQLSKSIKKNIQIITDDVLTDDIKIDNSFDKTMILIKDDNDKYSVGRGSGFVSKCNRNIKPNVHVNNEIAIMWEIDGDIGLDKKIFGGYIKSTVIGTSVDNWINMLEKVKEYIDKYGKRPNGYDKNNKEIQKLGSWPGRQTMLYKNNKGIMKKIKVRKLWEKFIIDYKDYFMSNIESWIYMLNSVKEYIDKYGKRPDGNDKKNKEIRQMGRWINTQQENYKKNKSCMKNNKIKKLWEKFVEEYKQYFFTVNQKWKIKLKKIMDYIDQYGKKPSQSDNKETIKMNRWFAAQHEKYEKNTYIMKDPKIRLQWEKFLDQYNDMFSFRDKHDTCYPLSKSDWEKKLEKIIEYIDTNKKKPPPSSSDKEIKKMGKWLKQQQHNYKKKIRIMKNIEVLKKWTDFAEKYKQYLQERKCTKYNILKWCESLEKFTNYIDKYNLKPLITDKNEEIKKIARWFNTQRQNYKNNKSNMKDVDIKKKYEDFMEDYKEHLQSIKTKQEIKGVQYIKDVQNVQDIKDIRNRKVTHYNILKWCESLEKLTNYIDKYNKKPLTINKNDEIKKMALWYMTQQKNYKKNINSMKDVTIKKKYEDFLEEYKQYYTKFPAKKTTTIKPKLETIKEEKEKEKSLLATRQLSEYQELSKTMTIQKSEKTKKMFDKQPDLWHSYHDKRDFSFKGYDNQDEIPINKIIMYLEPKNKKLKILDLGCGRNFIKKHFENNKKFDIIGYDYVEFNGSIECDISNLPNDDETIDICIFSQSLMGYNWKEYITEALRVLKYNGEMIIAESRERFDTIKNYIDELGYIIKTCRNEKSNRWFYLHILNDK